MRATAFLALFNSEVSDPGYNATAIKGNEQTKKAHAVKQGSWVRDAAAN
jgi:hypothetical protein